MKNVSKTFGPHKMLQSCGWLYLTWWANYNCQADSIRKWWPHKRCHWTNSWTLTPSRSSCFPKRKVSSSSTWSTMWCQPSTNRKWWGAIRISWLSMSSSREDIPIGLFRNSPLKNWPLCTLEQTRISQALANELWHDGSLCWTVTKFSARIQWLR